jgi:hypothetical protein
MPDAIRRRALAVGTAARAVLVACGSARSTTIEAAPDARHAASGALER